MTTKEIKENIKEMNRNLKLVLELVTLVQDQSKQFIEGKSGANCMDIISTFLADNYFEE